MQKIKNHRCGFISSQNRKGQAESDTKKKKVIIPIHSNPTRNRKFQKYSKDMQKIKKHHCGFNSRQNGTVPAKSDTKKKKKVLIPIHFNPIRTREFPKNSKKMQEFKKHHYGFISSQNGTGRLRMIRKKCYRSDPFQLDPE